MQQRAQQANNEPERLLTKVRSAGDAGASGSRTTEKNTDMEVDRAGTAELSSRSDGAKAACGVIIVNADDWGRDVTTTDRMLECARHEAISSVSAMVFMGDSERAAELAREHNVDAGLHLNLTLAFSANQCPERLKEEQGKLAQVLRRHRYSPAVNRPGLARVFDYVVKAQLEEYERLYGAPPRRIDGHQHMHLCANIISQGLLPVGTIVRRNFTFEPGEKGYFNRLYRRWEDRQLAKRYPMSDFFFDLQPLEPRRLERFGELALQYDVELEAHVIFDDQYRFLMDAATNHGAWRMAVARGYVLRRHSGMGTIHETHEHGRTIW